jgi:hypothetical protein
MTYNSHLRVIPDSIFDEVVAAEMVQSMACPQRRRRRRREI